MCVKRVPAPGARINITADGHDVDAAHLGFTTSPHEECAVEEAVRLTGQHGGDVTALTLGPDDAREQLRYAASVGATHGVLVVTEETATWDPQRTAAALTEAVRTIEAGSGTFDLILFGNDSADAGGVQVGVRVAHALGRPMVNAIKGIDFDADGDGGAVTARREVDGGFEVYGLRTPCALGVKEGLNLPRYPTMRGRLASKKLEIRCLEPSAPAGGQRRRRLRHPAEVVGDTTILGHGPEAAPAVVDLLEELGLP
ncbi:MAG: electron transfer flavoprotein subunit beta/FixA family protein [Acidimicrobiales bacterium]